MKVPHFNPKFSSLHLVTDINYRMVNDQPRIILDPNSDSDILLTRFDKEGKFLSNIRIGHLSSTGVEKLIELAHFFQHHLQQGISRFNNASSQSPQSSFDPRQTLAFLLNDVNIRKNLVEAVDGTPASRTRTDALRYLNQIELADASDMSGTTLSPRYTDLHLHQGNEVPGINQFNFAWGPKAIAIDLVS